MAGLGGREKHLETDPQPQQHHTAPPPIDADEDGDEQDDEVCERYVPEGCENRRSAQELRQSESVNQEEQER